MIYATVCRYVARGASTNDLANIGHALGLALSKSPGFVAAVAIEDDASGFITIGLFENRASLIAADAMAHSWRAAHEKTLGAASMTALTGEVVAQRGL